MIYPGISAILPQTFVYTARGVDSIVYSYGQLMAHLKNGKLWHMLPSYTDYYYQQVRSVCVGLDNYVYVTRGEDVFKYTHDLETQWFKEHGNTLYAVAVDKDGNVYIGGKVGDPIAATCVAYNSSGEYKWYYNHGTPIHAVAVNKDNEVYYGGTINSNNITLQKLIPYLGSWNAGWSVNTGGATVKSIAIDVNGDVYVGGEEDSNGISLRKYSGSDGSSLWSISYGSTVNSVAVDSFNNVYIGANRTTVPYKTISKYSQNTLGYPVLEWDCDHGNDVFAIAVDAYGKVYAGGKPAGKDPVIAPDEDITVFRKYDRNGSIIYNNFDHTTPYILPINAMAVTSAKSVLT